MMILKDSDGWPTSFNLTAAARIADTTVAALRTRIARNLLRYIGQRPLAGEERRFTVAGIYEIALIDELERNGLTQAVASKVVGVLFDREIRVALALYLREHPKIKRSDEARNLACIEADPDLWIRHGALGRRDITRPQLMLFTYPEDYPEPLITMADGWEQVPERAVNFQRDVRTLGRSTPAEAREFLKKGQPYLPEKHPDVQSGIPVFHILNITAVLTRVDERISDYLGGAPRQVQPLAQ
jgi:hypothetical protein